MVQPSQSVIAAPRLRSAEGDSLIVRLHRAENLDQLSRALYAIAAHIMPYKFINILFRPLEFELPCKFTPARYRKEVDAYMHRYYKHDIWLRRSPVHPGVTAVRHGDYTPLSILQRTTLYRHVLEPVGAAYAASIVAWRGNTWLATMTVMTSREQGEFTDAQMAELRALQPHFETVIHRLAGQHETRHVYLSVQRFVAGLDTASMLLDWDLRPLHYSESALRLCALWTHGTVARALKKLRVPQVPDDLRAAIDNLRPVVMSPGSAPRTRRAYRVIHPHPQNPALTASIEFLPARSLSLGKGTFLVTLHENAGPEGVGGLEQGLGKLSPRERECAQLAAEGLNNTEIARRLGKSQITVRNQLTAIYQKLGLSGRHKLIAAFAKLKRR